MPITISTHEELVEIQETLTQAGISMEDQARWMEVCGQMKSEDLQKMLEILADTQHIDFLNKNLQAKYAAFEQGDASALEGVLVDAEQYLTALNRE